MSASSSGRKRAPDINASTRNQLVVFARHSWSRNSDFDPSRPTKWKPGEVLNPNGASDSCFTDSTAWDFIASRLEAGEEVEVINLRRPRGSKGYVMKIDLGLGVPKLYVKLQLVSKKVIGRSFHYSE